MFRNVIMHAAIEARKKKRRIRSWWARFWEDGKLEEEDPALVVVDTNNFFAIAISRWLHKQRVKNFKNPNFHTQHGRKKFSKEARESS